jgi:hypothetical protein
MSFLLLSRLTLDVYFAFILKVAAGIYAIQAPGVKMTVPRSMAYAVAATYHGLRRGVDPFELVGIARNESDFVENILGPDGKDCGLTQTRVTVTRYSCRQLRRSYWLAFQEAAREMSENAQACRGRPDYDRCRFNRYNSGVKYARRGIHGAYWLRVQCFAEAARKGVAVGQACRRVRGWRDIAKVVLNGSPPVLSDRSHSG